MNYKVLYRKYRPLTFNDVSGQEHIVKVLQNALKQNKMSHAYIFTGPRGTGKTSMAKIFARSINCENPKDGNPCLKCTSCQNFKENPDIIEIDAASNNGVDEIRELINNIKLAPSNSKYKVYIIDEVHMLSQSAFNALLLTLEEPPAHAIFILATTDIQNVPITILSRTQRFDFNRISLNDITKRLEYVCQQENIDITADAINEIALLSEGGLRDALSILDQISSQENKKIDLDTVQNTFGTVSKQKIEEFIITIEDNNVEGMLNLITYFKNSSIDSKVVIAKLIDKLKNLAIDIKLDKVKEKRLNFDKIKSLILELTNNIGINISIDAYSILELIILDYMGSNEEKNYFPGNKIVEDEIKIVEEIKQNKKESVENNVDSNLDQIEELKKIRINNCFVDANKSSLSNLKEKWQMFLDGVQKKDDNLYMCISDSDIVASSEKYTIISTLSSSSAGLINTQLLNLEKLFKEVTNTQIKFVALDNNEWTKAKQEFIQNKNNNIKYELKPDVEVISTTGNEIEDIISDVFENVKIEME